MNRNFIFASLVAAIGLNIAIIGCHRKGDPGLNSGPVSAGTDTAAAVPDTTSNPYTNSVVEVRTYKNVAPYSGFGYDIYIDGHPRVHQPHLPALSGTNGFQTEEFARRAGELVAYKIRNNIMPPMVTPQELDSIGVLPKE